MEELSRRPSSPLPGSSFKWLCASILGLGIFAVLLLQQLQGFYYHHHAAVLHSIHGVHRGKGCAGEVQRLSSASSNLKSSTLALESAALVNGAKKPKSRKPQRHVHPRSPQWDNSVAICAVMKDEVVDDVMEWLEYHRWIGVDKIFLRQNDERVVPEIEEATRKMVQEGFLDLGVWPGQNPPIQQQWFNLCSGPSLAGAYSWILFNDLDEFLVILNKGEAVANPDLKAHLATRRGAAGISLQWIIFGSSGHKRRPAPGGPLRHFSRCTHQLSYQMKCLASSYHLCATPFTAPKYLHACAYRYEGDIEPLEPPILYGDGYQLFNTKPINVTDVAPVIPPLASPVGPGRDGSEWADTYGARVGEAPPQQVATGGAGGEVTGKHVRAAATGQSVSTCRSYDGHLLRDLYNKYSKAIPEGEALVLFHYVTRSFDDFAENKLSRYAGRYADDFRERRNAAMQQGAGAPSNETLFEQFEREQGFDRRARVCSSVVRQQYGERCCGQGREQRRASARKTL